MTLKKKVVENILGLSGGGVGLGFAALMGDSKYAGGAKAKKRPQNKKKVQKKSQTKKSKKVLYREYLDKKYSKEQLLKKCKSLGIKVTTRKNGMIKPIKKETLINKIVKLKFN